MKYERRGTGELQARMYRKQQQQHQGTLELSQIHTGIKPFIYISRHKKKLSQMQ